MIFSPSQNVPVLNNVTVFCESDPYNSVMFFDVNNHNNFIMPIECNGNIPIQSVNPVTYQVFHLNQTPTNMETFEFPGMPCYPNCVGQDYYDYIPALTVESDYLDFYRPTSVEIIHDLSQNTKDTVIETLSSSVPLILSLFSIVLTIVFFSKLIRRFRK